MAKKDKAGVDKLVKKVNKEFEKTSSQVESLINDAFKQFDQLQQQIQEPIRKLISEMDQLREREMKRFNDELERRMAEFQELQQNVLERIGMVSKEARKDAEKAADKANKKVTTAVESARKAAGSSSQSKSGSKSASTAKKKAPAKKSSAAKSTAKKADDTALTRLNGLGPATEKKMKAAGITSLKQIANPSAEEKKTLEQFKSMRGFDKWSAEAKKLIS